ncbi:MAG: hypothetical protein ACI8RZ_007651 [Myxococcota bacterium]|jgi:hypothetical protein
MPLAGRMRLNTFLAMLAAGVATCGAAGVIIGPMVMPEREEIVEPVAAPQPVTSSTSSPPIAAVSSAAATPEAVVMQYAGKDLGTSKKKDVTSGQPFKVNVYQDDGHSVVNRAKVDLDRDDKWDEKWTFDGGTITRQIAPGDDESYTVTQHWDGATWSNGAPSEAAVAAAPAAVGRPVDQFILARAGKNLGTGKVKDASKGQAFKVNLYQDDGHSVMNRAKVDLDRDDKWDEKWTLDGSSITRKVAPGDDESYTVEETWSGSAWQ